MTSIVSKLADEIKLHGSYEAYCAYRDRHEVERDDPEDVGERPTPEQCDPLL